MNTPWHDLIQTKENEDLDLTQPMVYEVSKERESLYKIQKAYKWYNIEDPTTSFNNALIQLISAENSYDTSSKNLQKIIDACNVIDIYNNHNFENNIQIYGNLYKGWHGKTHLFCWNFDAAAPELHQALANVTQASKAYYQACDEFLSLTEEDKNYVSKAKECDDLYYGAHNGSEEKQGLQDYKLKLNEAIKNYNKKNNTHLAIINMHGYVDRETGKAIENEISELTEKFENGEKNIVIPPQPIYDSESCKKFQQQLESAKAQELERIHTLSKEFERNLKEEYEKETQTSKKATLGLIRIFHKVSEVTKPIAAQGVSKLHGLKQEDRKDAKPVIKYTDLDPNSKNYFRGYEVPPPAPHRILHHYNPKLREVFGKITNITQTVKATQQKTSDTNGINFKEIRKSYKKKK